MVHLVEYTSFTLLITLGFHELNESEGKLFYFLSHVVWLYVPSIFIVDGQAVEMPLWYQIRMKGYADRLWQAKDQMPIQSH